MVLLHANLIKLLLCNQVIEQKTEWKTRWQSQLSELKRRSKCRDNEGNVSWATRLRQKRDGLVNEL